ncbi:hypothetical protein BURPS1710A_A0049 [Burkholderia pseudomallei 1710a]|uniref:Uncharacterized protein n=1 Tax=Burkholderia pseudomallei 1710a TaxID=320371 RepID=A0A0E1VW20_BURPE|nr:hypothetical protein BURPS1710A_A0049 [Burkholderia pseudomallei 1710a]
MRRRKPRSACIGRRADAAPCAEREASTMTQIARRGAARPDSLAGAAVGPSLRPR